MRETPSTRAPRAASVSPVARPMPRPAPVTIATLPVTCVVSSRPPTGTRSSRSVDRRGYSRIETAVHVFRDERGASRFLDEVVAESRRRRGTTFTVRGLGARAVGLRTPIQRLTMTSVLIRSGRIAGWALFVGREPREEEMAALARRLRSQIEAVLRGERGPYRGRLLDPAGPVVDASLLARAVLAQPELGPAYASLSFDWFFGGFIDNLGRVRDDFDSADERGDVDRSGRLVSYNGLYENPEAGSVPNFRGLVRVGTSVTLFRTAWGAAGYLADSVDDDRRQAGKRIDDEVVERVDTFDVSGITDDAAGVRIVTSGRGLTIVVVRRGRALGRVFLWRADRRDARAEAVRLARTLDERVERVLGPAAGR